MSREFVVIRADAGENHVIYAVALVRLFLPLPICSTCRLDNAEVLLLLWKRCACVKGKLWVSVRTRFSGFHLQVMSGNGLNVMTHTEKWLLFWAAITWMLETWRRTAQEWNLSKWPCRITRQMSFQQLLLASQRAERKAMKQARQVSWSDFLYVCHYGSLLSCASLWKRVSGMQPQTSCCLVCSNSSCCQSHSDPAILPGSEVRGQWGDTGIAGRYGVSRLGPIAAPAPKQKAVTSSPGKFLDARSKVADLYFKDASAIAH